VIDVERYLERIGHRGPIAPTLETLRQVHLAHLMTVPFENLSVRRGEAIVLEESRLFEKIVLRRRGGFCYELNGLFAALLRTLGFRVRGWPDASESTGFPSTIWRCGSIWTSRGLPTSDSAIPSCCRCGWRRANRRREAAAAATGSTLRMVDFCSCARSRRGGRGSTCSRSKPGRSPPSKTAATTTGLAGIPVHAEDRGLTRHGDGRITLSVRRLIVTSSGMRTETVVGDDAAISRVLSEQFGIEDPDLVSGRRIGG